MINKINIKDCFGKPKHILKSKKGIQIEDFIKKFINMDLTSFINSLLMKEPKDLIYSLVLEKSISEKEKEYIEKKLGRKDLSSFRDKKSSIGYASKLAQSWIIESTCKYKINSLGLKILNYGSDNEREFLTSANKIKQDPDLVVEIKGIFHKIEIKHDFGYVMNNLDNYFFRYNDYFNLKKTNTHILHLDLLNNKFSLFNMNEVENLQHNYFYEPWEKTGSMGSIINVFFFNLEDFENIFLKKISN